MTQPRIVHLDSLKALRDAAEAWDDLWRRSDATLPTLRAELLAQWVEQFARHGDFHAIAVELNGLWVAALPLVRRKIGRLLPAAAMPCNEWSTAGDFLWDASMGETLLSLPEQTGMSAPLDLEMPVPPVLAALAEAIREMPWPLLWLDEVELDAPRWQQLRQAFFNAGMTIAERKRWQVGRVEISRDWTAYKASWSGKHRQKMAWAARHLAQRGEVRLDLRSQIEPGEAASAMQQCFEIEDCGWKGAAGSSILRTPGMASFYIRQAQQAARWGQLELAFLYCGDRPAAFAYGLTAKGVFHSTKISYDPEFEEQMPGQLLRYFLLERFFSESGRKALDFQGELTESHTAWRPDCRQIGRLAVAPRQFLGRLAVQAYKHVWPLIRRH